MTLSSRTRGRRKPRARIWTAPSVDGRDGKMTAASVTRAIDAVAKTAAEAASGTLVRTNVIDADLEVGDNHVSHGLGRTPLGLIVVPKTTVAFDWSYDWDHVGNPHPDRIAVINVTAAVRARLVFF